MKRRTFLQAVGGVVGGSALGTGSAGAGEEKVDGMPRRALGRTGEQASIVGFPGLVLVHYEQEACTAALHKAFEQGVNYFDVAPAYGRGDAEIKMGVGLQGLDRGRYLLACKTKKRDKKGAREELERSLARLKTDHFDVYQHHCLRTADDVNEALGPGGAMETFLEAKEEGKVRFLGFSAHTMKAGLMAMRRYRFDTVMFPINFVELLQWEFGAPVLELAREQGAAVLAIKPMCRGTWPEGMERTRRWWYRPVEDDREISMALRFTLSQSPVVVGFPPGAPPAVSSPDRKWDLVEKAVGVGRSYRHITEPEAAELEKLAHTCGSVFRKQEEDVAAGRPVHDSFYAEHALDGCPCGHV